jgi:hypothetical protein
MKKMLKNWTRSPFFSSRLFFVLLIVIALFEFFDVITTENKQLIFEVELKNKEPQEDAIGQDARIVHAYKLLLKPDGWFSIVVLENNIGSSPLHLITFLIVWLCGLIVSLKLDPNDIFSHDLSRPLFIAALSLILFFFIERYTHRSFRSVVQAVTHNQYRLILLEHSWMMWSGIGLLWLAKMMKRGYQLQKDQDLTI